MTEYLKHLRQCLHCGRPGMITICLAALALLPADERARLAQAGLVWRGPIEGAPQVLS